MLKCLIGVTLLVSSLPAWAQSQPAVSGTPAAKPNPAERVICKTIEEIGSRLGGKRVCMTVSQWQEHTQRDREATEEFQRKSYQPR